MLQSGIALVLQVLSVGGCVATVVLATMGLVDCVKLLDDTRKYAMHSVMTLRPRLIIS